MSFGWVFTGAPGTGKTTVARRMGDMFAALGLLPDCTVNDVSASDLMTGYAGQTGIKTKEIMQQSRGGVLFIDEAYQLNPQRGGAYATEAVDELVKGMTSPEFKGKLLVILAGYKADMDAMMATNPGLQSRFAERLHFENLSVDATASALTSKMEALLPLASCARQAARGVAEALTKLPGFGNYRDVETLCQKTKQKVVCRMRISRVRKKLYFRHACCWWAVEVVAAAPCGGHTSEKSRSSRGRPRADVAFSLTVCVLHADGRLPRA